LVGIEDMPGGGALRGLNNKGCAMQRTEASTSQQATHGPWYEFLHVPAPDGIGLQCSSSSQQEVTAAGREHRAPTATDSSSSVQRGAPNQEAPPVVPLLLLLCCCIYPRC
jgi:hypothetical protein